MEILLPGRFSTPKKTARFRGGKYSKESEKRTGEWRHRGPSRFCPPPVLLLEPPQFFLRPPGASGHFLGRSSSFSATAHFRPSQFLLRPPFASFFTASFCPPARQARFFSSPPVQILLLPFQKTEETIGFSKVLNFLAFFVGAFSKKVKKP